MAALTCDKDELVAAFPCLTCLSEPQLLAVIALALCKINAADPEAVCDPSTLLSDAACLTCLSEKQMLQAVVALILNWGVDNGYIVSDTNLRGDIACMMCLTPKQIKAIILNQFCTGVADGNVFCSRIS